MSTTQITKKIEDLLELEKLIEKAKAEAEPGYFFFCASNPKGEADCALRNS